MKLGLRILNKHIRFHLHPAREAGGDISSPQRKLWLTKILTSPGGAT